MSPCLLWPEGGCPPTGGAGHSLPLEEVGEAGEEVTDTCVRFSVWVPLPSAIWSPQA